MATHSLPDRLQDEDELLAHLREMLRRGDVTGARAFVDELKRKWPEAAWVKHYACVLAPPSATMHARPPSASHDREYAWLQEHAAAYPGCWLAVLDDELIAADPDFSAVIRATSEHLEGGRALLYFQPGATE